jgi:predicted RNase H-like HicB family nuclease
MNAPDEEYRQYSMVLQWDPVDRIYVVDVPELPGCHTHGRTRVEAVQQGQDAIEGWIDAARAWGRPVPPPRVWEDQEDETAPATQAATQTGIS